MESNNNTQRSIPREQCKYIGNKEMSSLIQGVSRNINVR